MIELQIPLSTGRNVAVEIDPQHHSNNKLLRVTVLHIYIEWTIQAKASDAPWYSKHPKELIIYHGDGWDKFIHGVLRADQSDRGVQIETGRRSDHQQGGDEAEIKVGKYASSATPWYRVVIPHTLRAEPRLVVVLGYEFLRQQEAREGILGPLVVRGNVGSRW